MPGKSTQRVPAQPLLRGTRRAATAGPATVASSRRKVAPAGVGRANVASASQACGDAAVEQVDTSYLESLVGYNARRAALVIIDAFLRNMAVYGLRPVDFSVMSLIAHNPGITSRQLCTTLNIQPPNLVGMINLLQRRDLITRRPHPHDGRAMGLHLTASGRKMARQAEVTAAELEESATARLSLAEREQLMQLLRKIYT